jgi:phosphoenolpyruvate---glycerone phosphotransferase subunit DhaL
MGKAEFARMFAEAAKCIRERHMFLSELDSVAGDGDHGTTMLRVAEKMEGIDADNRQTLSASFKRVGWDVLGVDGGASSAILGTFFGGMGEIDAGEEIDCGGLAAIFEAGLIAVSKHTKAAPGDKTMMDALVPAVNAIHTSATSGETIAVALQHAAIAARSGAESTKSLIAKHGRARFLGAKTLGYPDAGAFSIAILFEGFSAAMASVTSR